MSVRIGARVRSSAEPSRVWRELTDWTGQSRWIPLTTVRVLGPTTGIGVRAEALTGVRVGGLPVGLLDRFVVTAWTPPDDGPGELEVLHLGPYFTGEGVFRVEPDEGGALISCTELFSLPAGAVTERLSRLALPLMRRILTVTLRRLARLSETT